LKVAAQVEPQSIPAGFELTVPSPLPANVTLIEGGPASTSAVSAGAPSEVSASAESGPSEPAESAVHESVTVESTVRVSTIAESAIAESAVAESADDESATTESADAESAVRVSTDAESAPSMSVVVESLVLASTVAESGLGASPMAESAVRASIVEDSVRASVVAESGILVSVAAESAIAASLPGVPSVESSDAHDIAARERPIVRTSRGSFNKKACRRGVASLAARCVTRACSTNRVLSYHHCPRVQEKMTGAQLLQILTSAAVSRRGHLPVVTSARDRRLPGPRPLPGQLDFSFDPIAHESHRRGLLSCGACTHKGVDIGRRQAVDGDDHIPPAKTGPYRRRNRGGSPGKANHRRYDLFENASAPKSPEEGNSSVLSLHRAFAANPLLAKRGAGKVGI
jgi:hypothetical protein